MFDEWRGDQNVKVSLKEKLLKIFKNDNARYDKSHEQDTWLNNF